jgi:hypothetical protein
MVAMPERRPELKLIAPSASPQEAAAIVAALERFKRATAPPADGALQTPDPWLEAAILDGVSREEQDALPDPWINT